MFPVSSVPKLLLEIKDITLVLSLALHDLHRVHTIGSVGTRSTVLVLVHLLTTIAFGSLYLSEIHSGVRQAITCSLT